MLQEMLQPNRTIIAVKKGVSSMNDAMLCPTATPTYAHPVAAEFEARPTRPINWKSMLVNVFAFSMAVASLVPHYRQVLEARRLNVPIGRVNQAEEQVELWKENKDCFRKSKPVPVKTLSNDQVSVTVCPNTGDILLDVQPSNLQLPHITRWVGLRDFEQRWTLTLNEVSDSVAYAQEPSPPIELTQAVEILCQRMVSPIIVARKVRYSNGVCYEQQINAASGLVISSDPVPCTPGC
jgi:hypothetical protein